MVDPRLFIAWSSDNGYSGIQQPHKCSMTISRVRLGNMYNNYLIYYYIPTVHHFQIINIEQILYIPVHTSMK
jgi:hypothetical protein